MTNLPASFNQQFINQLSFTEERWFAVYTKYKCEKYVVEQLNKKGISAYLPLVTKVRRYNRKVKKYNVPLINCYVFVHIKADDYVKTLETEYVMKFLKQGKDLLHIPQVEIDILKRVVGEVEDVELMPVGQDFEAGTWVEVVSGQLLGMKGRVIRKEGKHQFLIDLETLGYSLMLQVDSKLLKPIYNISV